MLPEHPPRLVEGGRVDRSIEPELPLECDLPLTDVAGDTGPCLLSTRGAFRGPVGGHASVWGPELNLPSSHVGPVRGTVMENEPRQTWPQP